MIKTVLAKTRFITSTTLPCLCSILAPSLASALDFNIRTYSQYDPAWNTTFSLAIQTVNIQGTTVGVNPTDSDQFFIQTLNGTTYVDMPGAFRSPFEEYTIRNLQINDAGLIAGYYRTMGQACVSFFYDQGQFIKLSSPSLDTHLSLLNNQGIAIGVDYGLNEKAMAWTRGGEIYTFDEIPGYSNIEMTRPLGITDDGQVLGTFLSGEMNTGWFIATPVPEPSTMLLFGFGLVGLVAVRKRING